MAGTKIGEAAFARFKVSGTPFTDFVDKTGSEVDWLGGFNQPAEKHHERVLKVLEGIDTFKSLTEQNAKTPKNVEVMTALARKYDQKLDGKPKAIALYKEVAEADPEGRQGTTTFDGRPVTCTEFAEFSLAKAATHDAKGDIDPKPLGSFMAKYPASPMTKQAINEVVYFYYSTPDRAKAVGFYEEIGKKFPADPQVLYAIICWILKDQKDLDLGIELSERVLKSSPSELDNWIGVYRKNLADLYLLKGDRGRADEAYGRKLIDDEVNRLGYDLINFVRFWTEKGMNLDAAEEMIETALKLRPDAPYFLQSAADFYFKVNKPEKALALYGPDYARKLETDPQRLANYARYWSARNKNVDSALQAALKSVSVAPSSYGWDVLAHVYFAMDRYDEALKAEEEAIKLVEVPPPFVRAFLKQIEDALAKEKGKKEPRR